MRRLPMCSTALLLSVLALRIPTLEVRKLGSLDRGVVGLWVGNNSDGDFANLRITAMK